MSAAIAFRDVDILFCNAAGRRRDAQQRAALRLLDEGADRATIAAKTGAVLGVAGASLTVERGRISVLMGLSGSGKSTLLRAANGLNRPVRGQVIVDDGTVARDIVRCDPDTLRTIRRGGVAMVFQQFALLPWRTVAENVALGPELRGVAKAKIARIVEQRLALVGLEQWRDRRVGELSGGMQQRVGLARAFATDADILLLDEPFSALDPLIRARLQDELLSLQERLQKTMLFVSHDLDEALKLGDQVTILREGRIEQSGAPQDIMLRPRPGYVADFVRHVNPLNVVTGAALMQPLAALGRDGDVLLLDEVGRYRLRLDDGALRLSIDGVATPVVPVGESPPGGAPVACPVDIALRDLLAISARNEHPILMCDGGTVIGICRRRDVLRALCP